MDGRAESNGDVLQNHRRYAARKVEPSPKSKIQHAALPLHWKGRFHNKGILHASRGARLGFVRFARREHNRQEQGRRSKLMRHSFHRRLGGVQRGLSSPYDASRPNLPKPGFDGFNGNRNFRDHRHRNRRRGRNEQRNIQQSVHHLGQVQKAAFQVHSPDFVPIPPHADGRSARRKIPRELAGRDKQDEMKSRPRNPASTYFAELSHSARIVPAKSRAFIQANKFRRASRLGSFTL